MRLRWILILEFFAGQAFYLFGVWLFDLGSPHTPLHSMLWSFFFVWAIREEHKSEDLGQISETLEFIAEDKLSGYR